MAAERLLLLLSEARPLKPRVKNAPATPDQWLYAPRIGTPKNGISHTTSLELRSRVQLA